MSEQGEDNKIAAANVGNATDDEFKPYLLAPSAVTMREEPNGPLRTFNIAREAFEPVQKGKGSKAPPRVLLLGFDTEYQLLQQLYTHEEITVKKTGRYEVLSYQAYAKLDGAASRYIIVPTEPHTRYNFVDFIVYVLAKLAAEGKSIPRSIIMVGHFNKADFPAFADRGQVFKKLAMIRKSLVTQGYPIKIRIMLSEDEADFEEINVHVRDSILMAPAGKGSLAAIGELLGLKKMVLHEDPAVELELKRNMKVVRDNSWEMFREYALLDAEISALYFEKIKEFSQAVAKTNSIPTSLSGISVKLLLNEWESRKFKLSRLTAIGKESFKEEVWNENTGGYITIKEEPYVEEVNWSVDFATECYHGGRSEQMWFGPSDIDEFSDYDLKGAYPTAMATIATPDWRSIRPTKGLDDVRLGRFGFACVDFKFPDTVRFPTLPIVTSNGIIFPLEGRSYCCAPEIELALSLGARLTLAHGLVIETTGEELFTPFIKQSIQLRDKATSDLEAALWKEVTNSSYGKMAQGLRRKRVFNLKTEKAKQIPESPITNPFFAAYTTSLVRAVIGEIMNAIPREKGVFSVTTDGFLTNATAEEINQAAGGPIAELFSKTRAALTGNASVLGKKHSVKRLLGWRVRGQATLEVDNAAGREGIVLAKAGIKTPPSTTTVAEQNEYIIEQFLTRSPSRKFLVDAMTTQREIMLFNADLVTKRTARAISMDYDFKRKPLRAWDAHFEFNGSGYQHLAFDTAPWKTVEEFKLARQLWQSFAYDKVKEKIIGPKPGSKTVRRKRFCLKTTADFRKFAVFHDMRVAVKGKSGAYLRNDLSRLRLDICAAYQQGAAGLAECRERYSAQQFADILNQCGFEDPVTRSHVEYGVRRKFKPHTTPPTTKVMRVLRKLSAIIPSLRPQEIIASLEGLPLLLPALDPQ